MIFGSKNNSSNIKGASSYHQHYVKISFSETFLKCFVCIGKNHGKSKAKAYLLESYISDIFCPTENIFCEIDVIYNILKLCVVFLGLVWLFYNIDKICYFFTWKNVLFENFSDGEEETIDNHK